MIQQPNEHRNYCNTSTKIINKNCFLSTVKGLWRYRHSPFQINGFHDVSFTTSFDLLTLHKLFVKYLRTSGEISVLNKITITKGE